MSDRDYTVASERDGRVVVLAQVTHTDLTANRADVLTPYERWMLKSNLKRVTDGETTADQAVRTLHANGYDRVARALKAATS